ncbi:ROK family protein [Echinicola jeungdonensis]|uniref:N-acetylglucosamine kinase n=1 Tax=Echinicola jeungdonensis TaxID=709343 RepID=A0ABV5J6C0_9BACT|nr:ROK family protein [Echinicola jeungdonensis]MDN3669827.1 ROK family protein [Echinicola jeungdonensis]
MNIYKEERVVMTLDAGGTNFVFSAFQGGKELIKPFVMPSHANDLQKCLDTIVEVFKAIRGQIKGEVASISIAFPGPADYKKGIIGDLPNFPAFKAGVPLKDMLEGLFGLPTFINNDGDLFAFGESVAGMLPEVNQKLQSLGINREYKNLFGVTLGTGFGGGMVINNQLNTGDNSASSEIWLTRNPIHHHLIAEEGVSIRAIQNVYQEEAGIKCDFSPKDIYEIALGEKEGDQAAAQKAFDNMAFVIAEALANAMTLIDGLIVIGGGLAGASNLIVPKVIQHLNGTIENGKGEKIPRLVSKVYNADDPQSWKEFVADHELEIEVPFTNKKVSYRPEKRIALGLSRLGTNRAVAIGAYAFALSQLDENSKVPQSKFRMLGDESMMNGKKQENE